MEQSPEPEKEPDEIVRRYIGQIIVTEIPKPPPEIYEGNPETTDGGW